MFVCVLLVGGLFSNDFAIFHFEYSSGEHPLVLRGVLA